MKLFIEIIFVIIMIIFALATADAFQNVKIDLDQAYKNIQVLESELKQHRSDLNQLNATQENYERMVSEAWQAHDDDLYIIKERLGLNK